MDTDVTTENRQHTRKRTDKKDKAHIRLISTIAKQTK